MPCLKVFFPLVGIETIYWIAVVGYILVSYQGHRQVRPFSLLSQSLLTMIKVMTVGCQFDFSLSFSSYINFQIRSL